MSANKEAVMFSIKKMIEKIHAVGFNSFESGKFEALIDSVPGEYKILYRDIPIDIDNIKNLLAYYHHNLNKCFQCLGSNGDKNMFESGKRNLMFFAEQSRKLIQMLNSIGYPIRLIRYKNEIKSVNKIKSKMLIEKIYEHERVFDMSEDSQITGAQKIQKITRESAKENARKCEEKIENNDYSGAITNSRSLVESVIKDIYKEITGKDIASKGVLSHDWNNLSQKLNLHSEKEPSDSLKKIMSGLISGLATIRNKMSDSHGNAYKAEKHHAVLAVNSAFAIVEFIYDAYNYQEKHEKLISHEEINPLNVLPFSPKILHNTHTRPHTQPSQSSRSDISRSR